MHNKLLPGFARCATAILLGIQVQMGFAAENSVPVATIDTPFLKFTLSSSNGACELLDKEAGIKWSSDPQHPRFGQTTIEIHESPTQIDLTKCDLTETSEGIVAAFHFVPTEPQAALRVWIRPRPDRRTLDISYQPDRGVEVKDLVLLADLLNLTDSTQGYVVVPVREGLLVPADSGLWFNRRFDSYAYEGCHMAMYGVSRLGAAVLVSWEDPYVSLELRSTLTTDKPSGSRQRLSSKLVLNKSALQFHLSVLGKGDYVTMANAYRAFAEEKGWRVPWSEKVKTHPQVTNLFGAANIKLWSALDRRMNAESTREESVLVNWTFAEAAQVAEHLKNDLKLERVLFTMGGWIHRGYDNQHPDILPTAPECGGNDAFSTCAKRVLNLGYLFCLHDNYQDIYRDSPSWNEKYIMKNSENKLSAGGHWAGGVAYLTCSQMAVDLAKRPQNLAAVKKLSGANAYFIDTTYAAGLQECFDADHPLTRRMDLQWKQELSDYARDVFGIFGSECGREWGIPHSDFFEGLTGVSGREYHDAKLMSNLGAKVVPLFDLVYRDCIAMYGKYGYDPYRAANYVLHHISLGRPLNYHSIPAHCYWKQSTIPDGPLGVQPEPPEVRQTAPRKLEFKYHWKVLTHPQTNWNVFVHFTDAGENIKFQGDYEPQPPTSKWLAGQVVNGPFVINVPDGLRGNFNVRIGLFQPASGLRAALQDDSDEERSYLIGTLHVAEDQLSFEPAVLPSRNSVGDLGLFTRAENGWGAGLHPMDRFIKNTCEVLCPLNQITAAVRMTHHEFLTPDQNVERTVFGDGPSSTVVIINCSNKPFNCSSNSGGNVTLPPYGFLVDSPTFVAFHALRWGGLDYDQAPLFTVQSLDQEPIATSKRVRVYHAFGSDQIRIGANTRTVPRESQF